jgi:hypothetical protein
VTKTILRKKFLRIREKSCQVKIISQSMTPLTVEWSSVIVGNERQEGSTSHWESSRYFCSPLRKDVYKWGQELLRKKTICKFISKSYQIASCWQLEPKYLGCSTKLRFDKMKFIHTRLFRCQEIHIFNRCWFIDL